MLWQATEGLEKAPSGCRALKGPDGASGSLRACRGAWGLFINASPEVADPVQPAHWFYVPDLEPQLFAPDLISKIFVVSSTVL